jgi:hypothetical protein
MTTPAAWPSGKNEAKTRYDSDYPAGQAQPGRAASDQGPAHGVIGEMAGLLRDVRGSMMTDGFLLGAVTIGLALEARLSAQAIRADLAGAVDLGLLGVVLICWLVTVSLLAWTSRSVLGAVSKLRRVTGAPLDPRPGWVTIPPTGADPAEWTLHRAHLLLGAAHQARYRMRFADTWTYLTGGAFLAWTLIMIVGW